MSSLLSQNQIESGRRTFHRFMSFNVLSFSILTGNVISVFAIKLDVSNTFIGLMQSFVQLSMVFVLVGRLMMQFLSTVNVFVFGWLVRYVFASLLLVIPFVVGGPNGAKVAGTIILIAAGGFNLFRGIGVAGQVPIVASLATGSDRGRFLSMNSILANSIALAGGLAIAILLGADAPIGRFVACFAFAIGSGFMSVLQIRRLPEPRVAANEPFSAFLRDVRSVLHEPALRRFLVYLVGFALGTSALMAFLVVLSKRAYGLPDNFTVLLVAIGNVGAIASGFVNRRLVDRSGAKAIITAFQLLSVAVAIGIALAAGVTGSTRVIMAVAFFGAAAAQSGLFVSSQAYYYNLYAEEKHRNLGMLYQLVNGSAGAIGAYTGGLVLDALCARMPVAIAFRWLFSGIAVIATLALVMSLFLRPDRHGPRRRISEMVRLSVRRVAGRIRSRVRTRGRASGR